MQTDLLPVRIYHKLRRLPMDQVTMKKHARKDRSLDVGLELNWVSTRVREEAVMGFSEMGENAPAQNRSPKLKASKDESSWLVLVMLLSNWPVSPTPLELPSKLSHTGVVPTLLRPRDYRTTWGFFLTIVLCNMVTKFSSLPYPLIFLLFAYPVLTTSTTRRDPFRTIALKQPKLGREPICCLMSLPPIEP